ncbi:MAG: hypothetical protein HY791_07110 [Deltaproteobacteria bacterium]|nr:hypothetical protein [Deltaproteobacteria bacterium]
MTLVLDAGAFVDVERGDRELAARIKAERRRGSAPVTHGAVVAQVWRGGKARQASLGALLDAIQVEPIDDQLGRRTGVFLARSRTSDVVDAALVLLARDGDQILTSDPDDLCALAAVAGLNVEIVPV